MSKNKFRKNVIKDTYLRFLLNKQKKSIKIVFNNIEVVYIFQCCRVVENIFFETMYSNKFMYIYIYFFKYFK